MEAGKALTKPLKQETVWILTTKENPFFHYLLFSMQYIWYFFSDAFIWYLLPVSLEGDVNRECYHHSSNSHSHKHTLPTKGSQILKKEHEHMNTVTSRRRVRSKLGEVKFKKRDQSKQDKTVNGKSFIIKWTQSQAHSVCTSNLGQKWKTNEKKTVNRK